MVTNGLITCFDALNDRSGLTGSTSVWQGLTGNATATPVGSPTFYRDINSLGKGNGITRGASVFYSGTNQYHQISDGALNVPYSGKTIMAAVQIGAGFQFGLGGAPNYGFRSIVGKANSNIAPTMLGRNWNLYVFNDNEAGGFPNANYRYHFQNWAVSDYVSISNNTALIVAFTQQFNGDWVFYHNGRPCGSGSPGPSYFTQYMYDANCPERIGTSGYNPATGYDSGGYWKGYIYNVSFYNRALTAEEVYNNYQILRNRIALSGFDVNPNPLPE